MEHIITGIAISIILPIVYGWFYTIKEKELLLFLLLNI